MAEKSATESGAREWTPPSQQPPPQYPAIKPGEPVPIKVVDPLQRVIEPKAKVEPVAKQVQPPDTIKPSPSPQPSGSGPPQAMGGPMPRPQPPRGR